MKIEYEEGGHPLEFENANECIELIREIESEALSPKGVCIYNSKGESLSCVLAAANTFLVYCPSNYSGVGSFSSLGGSKLENLDYWFCGHHSEACGENLVSKEILNSVITDFLDNGGLSKHIDWVAD